MTQHAVSGFAYKYKTKIWKCYVVITLGFIYNWEIGMLTINTNYASAFASNATKAASKGLQSAMEKLSTGLRINYAKMMPPVGNIDALTAEMQGLQMASRNAADAQSLIDTAEGALQETHTVLLRMRELSVQSANGTMTNSDRQHLNEEFTQLRSEIDRIAHNTKWAGQSTLNGTETDSALLHL